MKKAHRVALKPTPEQESRLLQHAGYARSAYNWAAGELRGGLDVGERLPKRFLRLRWKAVKGFIALQGKEASPSRSVSSTHHLVCPPKPPRLSRQKPTKPVGNPAWHPLPPCRYHGLCRNS